MEPILDVFSNDAFNFVTLTDNINKLPFVPGRLGALGLFTEAPVPTTSIALEEQSGILTLVNPTPRGGPGETRPKPLRRARVLKVPHYQLDDNVLAEEVQNVREFGPQMQARSVETYLSGRMEMFTAQLDATTEFQRVGAIKGLIVDRDGNAIYDLFSEFGVTAVTPINFALGSANTAVRKKCSQLVRTMSQTLGGVAFTSVYALCGDTFWDDLIEHAEVRDTYRYQEGVRLREGVVFSTLKYGGVTFENYRGWIGGGTDAGDTVTPFIDPNEAHFFPLGTPNLFKTFFAPADYIETVNTLGLPRYAKAIPSDNNKSVRLEMQTNPLSLCLRPRALIKGLHH